MNDYANLLPLLMQMQGQKQPVQQSPYDLLAKPDYTGYNPLAPKFNPQDLLALQPPQQPIVPQAPVVPQAPAPVPQAPVVPQVPQEMLTKGASSAVPTNEKAGMMDWMKNPEMARAMILMGMSQLSGESGIQTATRGFGALDQATAKAAAAKQKDFENRMKYGEFNNKLKDSAATRNKDAAQSTLYGAQAETQASVREKNKASAAEARANAVKAGAMAKKYGVEAAKLKAADTGVMDEIATGLGYTAEELDDGKYLENPEFFRKYNGAMKDDSLKMYNKFDATERKAWAEKLSNPEGQYADLSASDILEYIDMDQVYDEKDQKQITRFITNQIAVRDRRIAAAEKKAAEREAKGKSLLTTPRGGVTPTLDFDF